MKISSLQHSTAVIAEKYIREFVSNSGKYGAQYIPSSESEGISRKFNGKVNE
jgi:hypothetical protein